MRRFRLSTEASEDLIAIYIQGHDLFGPIQADRYQDELSALFDRLAAFPQLAPMRFDYAPPARIITYKAHVVIYDETPEGVVIQRVRHSHEDWQTSPGLSDARRSEP